MTSTHHAPPVANAMLHDLAHNWWLVLLRGICAVLFGFLAVATPGITLTTLVLLFGAYALADGVLAVAAAIFGGQPAPRWWLAIVGLLGIAAGIGTLLVPGITALVLLYAIAVWAVATGLMQIVGAIRLRNEIDGEWMLVASGLLSVLFGAFLLLAPGAGALGLVFVIGVYATLYGVMLIGFAVRLKTYA